MNAARQISLFCCMCMGIVTVFLLACGHHTPVRSAEFVKTPILESGAFQALPAVSTSFRQSESRPRHRSTTDGPESSGAPSAFIVSHLVLPPRSLSRIAFFRDTDHILRLHEIEGMLPFPLGPPVFSV